MDDTKNTFSIFDNENVETISTGTSQKQEVSEDNDEVVISGDIIATIAGKAATSLHCVSEMSSSVAGDIVESLGVKNPTKGVLVEMEGENAIIDIYVIVRFGKKFSDIAWEIQEKVKTTVENMTGVMVASVNVHVQGVSFDDEKQEIIS